MAGAPLGERDRRYGLFRRNRTLLIVFVDILLFLILAVFLVRFLYSQTPKTRLEGYAVTLRGLVYGEVVYATLTVKPEGGQRPGAVGDGRLYARLALSREARQSEWQFLSVGLPGASEPELVLREALSAEGADARTLYAEVRIGGTTRRLSVGLSR